VHLRACFALDHTSLAQRNSNSITLTLLLVWLLFCIPAALRTAAAAAAAIPAL
jgi:hypothetical protein